MVEKKRPQSIRVDDETFARFRELATEFPDQGAALNAMLKAWDISKTKTEYPQYLTDIERLETNLTAIRDAFTYRLEGETKARAMAREEFRAMIERLEAANSNMQASIESAQAAEAAANKKAEEAEARAIASEQTASQAIAAREAAEANVAALKNAENERHEYIASLLRQLDSVQEQASRCASAEEEVLKLRVQLNQVVSDSRVAVAEAEARKAAEVTSLLRQVNDLQGKLHDTEKRVMTLESELETLRLPTDADGE